jgi:hypothetical protein
MGSFSSSVYSLPTTVSNFSTGFPADPYGRNSIPAVSYLLAEPLSEVKEGIITKYPPEREMHGSVQGDIEI